MADPFEPERYIRIPLLDVASSLTFAHKVLAVAPKKPPAAVKKALVALEGAAAHLQRLWTDIDRMSPMDRKSIDNQADVSWAALFDRLDAYGRIPPDRYPRAARAAALRDSLFPTGLSFLKADYDTQWAEMHKRVERIRDEKLQAEMETLAGADVVAEALRTYDQYGAIVGVKPGARPAEAPLFLEPLRALVKAITGYGIQMAAWHEDGDDAVKAEVRAALLPLDEMRAAHPRGPNGNGEGKPVPAPDTLLPLPAEGKAPEAAAPQSS